MRGAIRGADGRNTDIGSCNSDWSQEEVRRAGVKDSDESFRREE